jgi:hypothetical protein
MLSGQEEILGANVRLWNWIHNWGGLYGVAYQIPQRLENVSVHSLWTNDNHPRDSLVG